MENHPIPQDVTGFKFKLIGSVTLKQFLYIMGGVICAAVCYFLPISGFIKFPLIALFGGIGAALAFLPIEGRPMDVMMKNFLKALPAENQYIFRKRGADALIAEFFSPQTIVSVKAAETKTTESSALDTKRALLFKTLRGSSSYGQDGKDEATLTNINSYLNESSHSASPSVQNIDSPPKEIPEALHVVALPTVAPAKEVQIAKPAPQIQIVEPPQPQQPEQVVQPDPPHEAPPPMAPAALPLQQAAPPVVIAAAPQLTHVRQAPQEAIAQTAAPLQTVPTTPAAPAPTVTPGQTTNVTSVAPEATLKAGFPQLPDTPNIVMGIIMDPRGRVLPNILVEIMDMQGIPVRAFKTNALGQFAAATPLSNGEYNVLLEDPRKTNEFEQIHIILDGKIFQPLEIVSTDQREKLRRELFGATSLSSQVPAGAA